MYFSNVRRIILILGEALSGLTELALNVRQSLVLYGQATKCTRWMPRQLEAMKGAGACEKVRGAGKHALILTCPNGGTHLA